MVDLLDILAVFGLTILIPILAVLEAVNLALSAVILIAGGIGDVADRTLRYAFV